MTNQLSTQTSPYLLQHAENPVDWHPWGESALQLAAEQDKPILLSIGYSACHWCHVMERESFEDEAIAAKMNALFVCIKVDREERPDLDKIYQLAHQMLSQRPGGWPLTVALTPSGHAPFFAGTYFPPAPRMGMPGFGEVLEKVAAHYQQHRAQMGDHHRAFEDAMDKLNPQISESTLPDSTRALNKAAAELTNQFDSEFGGFGNAPKFPHPTQLELLLCHARREVGGDRGDNKSDDNKSGAMVDLTLGKMAAGGLFDQLGGGFYRYSVDRQWRIPHFEKMLYDNAQLLALYADGLQQSGGAFYRAVIEQTAAWVIREMQQEHGGYASTLDADSEGVEGKYYVWSETDLRALLNAAEYEALENHYDLAGEPNFEGQWHLTMRTDGEEMSVSDEHYFAKRTQAGGAPAPPDARPPLPFTPPSTPLQDARRKLLTERAQRVRPALDDKILTAWNGMMIKGMARAARVLGRDDWVKSAQDALDFIRSSMWQNGRLLVTSRNGEARLNGYLDDYAFLAEGIVELLQAAWRSDDLNFAINICDAMLDGFEDTQNGGFFFTSHDHEKLLYRPKTGADDAIPSGNGAATHALCKLGHLLGNTRYLESAQKTLHLFAPALTKTPSVHGSLTLALLANQPTNRTIIIRGQGEELRAWQSASQHPQVTTFAIPTQAPRLPPTLAQRKAHSKTIAYVCEGFKCSAPIDSLEGLVGVLGDD